MSWRAQQLANFKEQLEIASSVRMTHPDSYDAPCPTGAPMDPQSTQDIKDKLKQMARLCVSCRTLENKNLPLKNKKLPLKVCSNCQARLYCSRECQRNDWPEHKRACLEIQGQRRVQKLAKRLLVNLDLSPFLNYAAIMKLGLLKSANQPFCILVHLVVEPVDILDFAKIRGDISSDAYDSMKPSASAGKMEGMLQVSGILPCTEQFRPEETLRELWRVRGAKDIKYASGNSGPVGAILFVLGDARFEHPTVMIPGYYELMKETDPFTQTIEATGRSRTLPYNVDTCIEYINTKIRADKENRFLLHTEVTAADEGFIRTAAKAINPQAENRLFLELVQQRMRNEYIYKILRGLTIVPLQ